jgi:ABC-type Fe3+ transport system permease subunit
MLAIVLRRRAGNSHTRSLISTESRRDDKQRTVMIIIVVVVVLVFVVVVLVFVVVKIKIKDYKQIFFVVI